MIDWTPIEGLQERDKPRDGKMVLLSIEGYEQACIGGRWGNEWLLVNAFGQMYRSDTVKVTAFMELPKAYKK